MQNKYPPLFLLQSHTLASCVSLSRIPPRQLAFFALFHHLPPPLPTSLHPLTICLLLIKISKIQMAAGWLLSGNLPLIITGGEARRSVGLAETNGKLDFFTELEWGAEIYILTSHQLAVDQDKCFGLVGEGGSKLSVMLCGTLIRFLQSPPGCREGGSNRPSSPGAACARRTGWRQRRGRRGRRVNLFFLMTPSSTSAEDLNQNVNVGASEGPGLWDMLVLIIWSELELLCSTTECVFPRCSVTGITQSSTGVQVCC